MAQTAPNAFRFDRRLALGIGTVCAWLLALASAPAQLISSFQADEGGWQLGTIAVGNLDGSPDQEIVVPYRDSSGSWYLDAFKYTGQRLPGFPYAAGGDPINVSPTLYDLNHDGRDEIIFTCANHVVVLRGDGSVMWSSTVDSASYVPQGGYQTVTNGFYWWPTGAWLSHLPSSAVFSSEVSPPIVTDLSGNGKPEVLTGWKIQPDPVGGGQDYNPFIYPIFGVGQWGTMGENWSGGVVTFDALTGKQTFVYHLHQLIESGLAVGRAKPTGALNVYALNDSDSVVSFDKSLPFGLWGKGMLHQQFGKNQRLMTGSYLVPIDIYTADIDGDGLDEVLVAGTELSSLWQPNETILDDDGRILWRRWLPHLNLTNNCGWLNSACLIPVNPDHDNHVDVLGWNHSYELTFRYWDGIELVDRPGWPKTFYPLLPTPPVVGDVDGDGAEEIVVGTYDPTGASAAGELRIYALDGTLKQSTPVPGGIKQIPALADVEGVGRLDVVCRSLLGKIYVWNFGATGTNLVSWATHRGNMHRDGNSGISLYPPGTPLVPHRSSGYNQVSFGWTNAVKPQLYRIYRSERSDGPYRELATLTADTSSYTDSGLAPGRLYFYEVGADYGTNIVRSPPFALLSFLNGNLVANPGFERNDNCAWDKWFTGTIGVTNMCGCTNEVYQGNRSLEILLQNQSDSSSIAQFNQYGLPDSTLYVKPGAFYSFGGFFKSARMSIPSEHWLEWSSTKTAYDTNTRPALPDPDYFTPHLVLGATPVDWTYVNRTFQLPAGFPNIELRHRFSAAGPVSGSLYLDNVFFRQIPAPNSTNWTTLVPFGAKWRYHTLAPPANWYAPNFDDSSWPLANAKFGAGSGPTNIATRLPQFCTSYWFRTSFRVEATNIDEFLLSATCTGASVTALYPLAVWLNGMPLPTTLDTVTLQGNQKRYFDLVPYVGLLHPGSNVIAIRMGNTWSDYDDVAFDVRLQVVVQHSLSPCVNLLRQTGGSPRISVQTPAGSIWQLEKSNTSNGPWQLMDIFTNQTGGTQIFQDIDQSEPNPPQAVPMRCYRLVPF